VGVLNQGNVLSARECNANVRAEGLQGLWRGGGGWGK
jgi:hypothetical protein